MTQPAIPTLVSAYSWTSQRESRSLVATEARYRSGTEVGLCVLERYDRLLVNGYDKICIRKP
jgi:hypothetical protein